MPRLRGGPRVSFPCRADRPEALRSDGPTGQMTWHIHDSELPMFDHLGRASVNTWDGHTTEEKYERLAELTRRPTRAER